MDHEAAQLWFEYHNSSVTSWIQSAPVSRPFVVLQIINAAGTWNSCSFERRDQKIDNYIIAFLSCQLNSCMFSSVICDVSVNYSNIFAYFM